MLRNMYQDVQFIFVRLTVRSRGVGLLTAISARGFGVSYRHVYGLLHLLVGFLVGI